VTALGTLGEIARRTDGRVIGDPSICPASLVAIDDADAASLTFATDERYLRAALVSRAVAILTDEKLVDHATPYAKPLVAVPSVRLAMAALLALLEPARPQGPFVHPMAAVDPSATVGAEVYLDAHAVVGAGASIGAGSFIGAGAIVGSGARLGANCFLHPRAYVAEGCVLGARVVLQSGAVIGSDGFGYAFFDGELHKIPQIGIVELGDDVEIGANSCVDRAQTGVTSIGAGTKIDNLCQIGHNCRIGTNGGIAALSGLAGTTIVGDYAQIGGMAGFAGHVTVGSRVKIASGAGVWGDIPDDAFVSGIPARNHRDELKVQASLRRLPKLYDRVAALERSRTNDLPNEH
jgi:UDP-3-O-[3-hydroxymyristoyl] glucosamine N-acyltransferase